jgi:hypothetical protein
MIETIYERMLSIIGLSIGLFIIMFRKPFVKTIFSDQLLHATPQEKEMFTTMSKGEYGWIAYKIAEVVALIVGFVFLIANVSSLFLPAWKGYVAYIFGFVVLLVIAGGGAGMVTWLLMPLFIRQAESQGMKRQCDESGGDSDTSGGRFLMITRTHANVNDPVLRKLRRRALIKLVLSYVLSLLLILLAQVMLIRITL